MNITSTMIETVSGRLVDLADPKPDDILATDIAWALSREPRFGGHTVTARPYSVAQHSIAVADLISEALRAGTAMNDALTSYLLEHDQEDTVHFVSQLIQSRDNRLTILIVALGLLHDASEAYLRDLPSPVKSLPGLNEAYRKVEKHLMEIILCKFKVAYSTSVIYAMSPSDTEQAWRIVHWADLYARTIEAYHFMPSRGQHWASNQKISIVDLQRFELPKDPVEVYQEFLDYLDELTR